MKDKKSWISNIIENASAKKGELLEVYQNQGTSEAKQKLGRQTAIDKK